MQHFKVHTLDLNFQGRAKTIGVFLVPHRSGAALVECGPRTTIPTLLEQLEKFGYAPTDITDVFLTHIHLDHAGSAGWWATEHGVTIHVHDFGAQHMVNPGKLIASAARIYGDKMDTLWGEIIPVPETHINILYDNESVEVGGITFRAMDTPGHANHHLSYLLQGICFSGDVGGVHMKGVKLVRLPTVPPEFHIGKWRNSLKKFRKENIQTFATTHFGVHEDAAWHLDAIEHHLDEIESWMEAVMPGNPSKEYLRSIFKDWLDSKAEQAGLTKNMITAYDTAISSQMSADGIYRYWHKYRANGRES
jgi:glyoxylase-like metal-dependent hydrolase (beta-lactamase superfamily II)